MKLTDLQAFVDIVEAGGLTAAATRRGVTQPALSRLLRDLETRLRVQLLHRTGRGIELTPAGTEFLSFAQETLQSYDAMRLRVAERAQALPDELRLCVPLRVGRLLIPDLYRRFGSDFPQTQVHIVEEHSERAREMLAAGRLDAALTYRAAPGDRDFVPIFAEDLYAVGNSARLPPDSRSIPMQALRDLPLLIPSAGRYRDLIQQAFHAAGVGVRTARELETAEGLLAFAAEGEGVAILPMSNIYQEVARGEVTARRIVDHRITRLIGAQIGPGMTRHTARPVLAILRAVMAQARADADWRAP